MATTITTDLALLRLLQLSSAALPVGAYAFSMGLEQAIASQWLKSADEVESWLGQQLQYGLGRTDLPVLFRLYEALEAKDETEQVYWNDYLLACRETSELSLSDTATGEALVRLLQNLDPVLAPAMHPVSFVTAFASAAHGWRIPVRQAATGLLWSWMENQVVSATKLMPLGQTRAQQMLVALQKLCPELLDRAEQVPDGDIGSSLPGLALASCWHETQYSRLFRS